MSLQLLGLVHHGPNADHVACSSDRRSASDQHRQRSPASRRQPCCLPPRRVEQRQLLPHANHRVGCAQNFSSVSGWPNLCGLDVVCDRVMQQHFLGLDRRRQASARNTLSCVVQTRGPDGGTSVSPIWTACAMPEPPSSVVSTVPMIFGHRPAFETFGHALNWPNFVQERRVDPDARW